MGGFLGPGFGALGAAYNAITDMILAAVEVVLSKAIAALAATVAALAKAVSAIVSTLNAVNSLFFGFLLAIVDVWNKVKQGFGWLVGLKDFFGSIFSRLRDWLRVLFENGWKGVLPKILQIIQRLRARLAALLQPIIAYLKHMRAFWDFYFRVYVRPILNLIQHLRQVLLIFRVFHLKFAAALDRRLAALESDIAGLFLDTRKQINRMLNYFNLILDPGGLFQVGTYLKTAARSIGELIGLIEAVQTRDLFASELDQVAKNKSATSDTYQKARLDEVLATGHLPHDAAFEKAQADWYLRLKNGTA